MNLLALAMLVAVAQTAEAPTAKTTYDHAIEPYVAHVQNCHESSVDYVMRLFEKHDIVILCERWHAEVTQWDLIYDITSDPRFIDRVGHVFTEYVTVSLQPFVDELMNAKELPEDELHQRVLHVFRNFGFLPIWDKAPFYGYLKKLHRLNSHLPKSKKVQLHVTDLPFDWSDMNVERYREFNDGPLNHRDEHMANVVIQGFREICKSSPRKKCLVIMNYRHAFQPVPWRNGKFMANTGTFVFQAYPNTTANVLISTNVPKPTSDKWKWNELHPFCDGKWDAAFEANGNPNVGFDFAGSPFGEDSFDLFPHFEGIRRLHYRDVFTGFVFHRPLREHLLSFYVPGLYDDEAFIAECDHRFRIWDEYLGRTFEPLTKEFIQKYESRRGQDFKDTFDYAKQKEIDRWLGK